MLQPFFLWVLLALSLPSQSIQACFNGKEAECENADFAPGSDLAGEGFDITTMQRKGAYVIDMSLWKQSNKSCTLCKNPFMKGQKQKLPLAVVDWRASRKCRTRVSSSVYQSSESLLTSSASSIENNWKVGIGFDTIKYQASMALAGTNSKLADYSMAKTKKDKYSFTSHGVTCGYYSYRLSSRPRVHPELSSEFARLPKTYNKKTMKRFYQLIDKFGTHYITKVSLGGAVHSVTSIKQCEASLQGLSVDEVKTCLGVEASAGVMKVKVNTEFHHCKRVKEQKLKQKSFSAAFSDRFTEVTGGHTEIPELLFSANADPQAYKDWLSSLPQHPDVLTYSLESLHELVPKKRTHKHLRLAIRDYILQRGLWKNCSSQCQAGIKTNFKKSCICSCHNLRGIGNDCCPKQRGLAQITVTVEKATGLWGDTTSKTDAYVKAYRNGKTYVSETPVIWNNNNPKWNRDFNFDVDDLTLFKSLKLEVWDRDNKWDGGHTEIPELLFSANADPQAYKDWLSSLPQHPDVLTYSLESLHELVPKKRTHKHLRLAIRDYILQRGLWKNCSSQCQAGIKTNFKKSCICSCHNVRGIGNDCCPKQRGLAQITVTVEKATGLWGDTTSKTDAYVNAYRNGKTFVSETPVIWNNNNPKWNHDFSFDVDDLTLFKSLKLDVWDRDNKWDDDLLGVCNVQLRAGTKSDFCRLNHGLLYYKVNVKCIPSLSGPTCSDYVSTPMSPQLEKIYVSRHARPIPREILTEIGVLLNEDKVFSYQNLAKKDENTKL